MNQDYFNFFIYSDSGSPIYKLSSHNDLDNSIQGILQALFFTSVDLNFEIKTLSTDYGILAFKSFKYSDQTLLLSLIFPDYFGDHELAEHILNRILDYLYNCLVVHIGLTDLFSFTNPNEIDTLKKLIQIFEPSLIHLLKNWRRLDLLLMSQKKFEISREVFYPIKHYMENFKTSLKNEFICLTINSAVIWSTQDWNGIEIIDRLIFLNISEIYCESDINEVPVYFSKTNLENEMTGKTPFKLFCINILSYVKLIILSDSSLNIKKICESFNTKFFDEFFLSRLMEFKNVIQLGNLIDTTAKSLIIMNKNNYNIMIDETLDENFSHFIQNVHFCNILFQKNPICDEFYIKDKRYTFYYYKIEELIFLILFDKDTTIDDVNNVKNTIKNTKFELKEI